VPATCLNCPFTPERRPGNRPTAEARSDANVLFSRTLRDYVLYAADEGTIEVHWSRQILAEMSRTCARI
jgi:hypothetical protein